MSSILPDIFGKILNWRLLSGGHEFPGEDGGTCINEAAIVAAGFKYREVGSADDLPRCFSKPIGQLAITINDESDETTRQNMMPLVTRFAGTADALHIEKRRIRFFLEKLIAHRERILPSLTTSRWQTIDQRTLAIYNLYAWRDLLVDVKAAKNIGTLTLVISQTPSFAFDIWNDNAFVIECLGEAMSIGKQATPIERSIINSRVERVLKQAAKRHEDDVTA